MLKAADIHRLFSPLIRSADSRPFIVQKLIARFRGSLWRTGRLSNKASRMNALAFLIAATTLETTGGAVIRLALGHRALAARVGLFAAAGTLLLGYGLLLNLAP
jgi:hypothetical protein